MKLTGVYVEIMRQPLHIPANAIIFLTILSPLSI